MVAVFLAVKAVKRRIWRGLKMRRVKSNYTFSSLDLGEIDVH